MVSALIQDIMLVVCSTIIGVHVMVNSFKGVVDDLDEQIKEHEEYAKSLPMTKAEASERIVVMIQDTHVPLHPESIISVLSQIL